MSKRKIDESSRRSYLLAVALVLAGLVAPLMQIFREGPGFFLALAGGHEGPLLATLVMILCQVVAAGVVAFDELKTYVQKTLRAFLREQRATRREARTALEEMREMSREVKEALKSKPAA